MHAVVRPSTVSGTITAPASKSAMQRACAAALIKGGKTVLHNPGISDDDNAALNIIEALGALIEDADSPIVEVKKDELYIEGWGVLPITRDVNCHESGLGIRMFTPIIALSDKAITVTGEGSLKKRPMDFFDEILPQLDVKCKSNNGFLPLIIQGPLQPKNIEVNGSLSSQFLTGLLFAYAAADASDVTIKVRNLNSKPYVDLTLSVMAAFGLKTPLNNNYEDFYFPNQSAAQFKNKNIHYTVEGDWSGGAFLLVAGAIAGNITVKGLDIFSNQADKAILGVLRQTGVNMRVAEDGIEISETSLKAFQFDATDCPDLFPPLAALAAFCDGTSSIEGVHRLTNKESNRALTLQEEFGKMGVEIQLQDDKMLIKGGGKIKGSVVHSHHDHRIAMACAVAALRAEGEVRIDGAEAVNKSYPQFWEHLRLLQKDGS